MTQISARKRDLTLLSICSAFPILPVAAATAQTPPQTQQKVESPNVPELIAPVEDDIEAVFSPPRPSQPDKLVTSDQIDSFTSGENTEVNQAKISSDHIDALAAGEKAETKQTPETAATSIDSEIRIITPVAGVTTAKTTNLGVQYHPDNQVTVTLNGKPIDAAISQYLHKDEAQQLNTLIWYNVPLNKGENTITAQGADGKSISVKVTVEEVQKKIAIAPSQEPRIPADGRSLITLEGKITDEKGEIITEDTPVTLTASAGQFVGADQDKDAPGFQVLARKGEFTATLQAGLIAQNVKIRAAINQDAEIEAYTNVEFITNLRPSLATGSINVRIGAGGTDYRGSFRDYLNPDKIGRTSVDVDAAVFATGKVGDWLFTGAFNSKRPLNQDCNGDNRLFGGIQSCEKDYPVYGDSSSFTNTAPSTDSVYARIERTPDIRGAESDYFMWGDYSTEEFARSSQLYTATTRQLHGFKGNYNFGNLQLTALYANNIQGFQRDAITPNGTSGYYFLSRRLVIPGSENVFIEAEEINRPGTALERKALSRGSDYEIDYDRGTLLFRRPIVATELNPFGKTLVRRIVVTYQNDAGEDSKLYAGRLQYNLRNSDTVNSPNGHPFIGASYLREDQGQQDFELYGFDFFAPLGNSGQIIGEYAHSRHNTLAFGNVSGSAYRLEASANLGKNFQGQAYYRSVTENFANNATWSFTPGQTRYGAALTGKLGQTTSFSLGYDREDNFGIAPAERTQLIDLFNPQPQAAPGSKINNSLTTIRAGIQQKIGQSDLSLEYVNRSREDRITNQFNGNASQLVSRLDVPLSESLTFHAQNELNLGKSDPLYPNRTTFGLDWALYPGVSMRLAHQFYEGGLLQGNSITSLDTIVEHKFSPDTTVRGRYSILGGADGMTDQGSVSLNHGIRLAPGLKLSLGYEHIFKDIFGDSTTGIRFAQPYAVGQTASSLGLFAGDVYSIGLDYTDNPNFQANARLEHRSGSEGNHTVISAAASGKLSPALTAAVRYQQAGGANQLLQGLGDTANLRVGLAYRDPNDDKFNALLGYEYRQNPATTPDTLLAGSGNGSIDHIFSAEAIYAPNWQWELYGKYAFRSSSTSLSEDFTNHSSVHLAQLRTTYQLGYRTDLAVEGRWLGQPEQGFNEFGLAIEGGYHLTPDLRIGVGYAFGSADDRDFSGYRSAGGPYLNISFKLNELFGGFGRQKVVPPQQQESVIQPVALESNDTKKSP
ncbi:hypothetical protein [Aulosira sp. FACHB-615]|uniref:hypothetical protein n=1 Tax=Aulosira sp. FACHB-615 TaxID=2692777 RepID=UPI0016898FAA|nr:hypothetical protein [Aulosira sp. FACHB-615]MBD2489783.1 hypothetical protein [Aulosira sp. FACHB-615]